MYQPARSEFSAAVVAAVPRRRRWHIALVAGGVLVLLGTAGAGYEWYSRNCCSPPIVCCAKPLERDLPPQPKLLEHLPQ